MAIIEKKQTETGIIGIWEINESLEYLYNVFQFSELEKNEFKKISSENRKKEYLIARLLLEDLLGYKPEIDYEKSGRPILLNARLNVSISHSAQLVVAFVASGKIGVDVENMERNIEKVAPRFLHKSEWDFIETSKNQKNIKLLIWCAKEAIFKCCTEQGIQFNRQLIVEPFEVEESGIINGQRINETDSEHFKLTYCFYKNNVVVYCIERKTETQ